MPALREAFDAPLLAKLVVTTPALFVALLAPVSGQVLDRLGRRGVFLGSLLAYAAAGTSGLWLPQAAGVWGVLAGRAALGVALAGTFTAATALIGDLYDEPRRSVILGRQGAAMATGGIVASTLGGVLADVGWQWPFAIYAVAALVFAAALTVPEPNRSGDDKGENDKGGGGPGPVLPAVAACAAAGLAMLLFYLIPTQLPVLLRDRAGASGTLVGVAIAVSTAFSVVGALARPRLAKLVGTLGVQAAIFGLIGGGFVVVGLFGGSYAAVLGAMALTGLGMGPHMPNATSWLMAAAGEGVRGRRIGWLTASVYAGQFASPLASDPLAAPLGRGGVFLAAAAILAALSALCVAAALTPAKRALVPA